MTDYSQVATSVITDVQSACAARFHALPWLAEIFCTYERLGNITASIDQALNSLQAGFKQGIGAVILTPKADDTSTTPGAILDPFWVILAVYESVPINTSASGSNKACADVALNAMRLFKGWRPPHCTSPLMGVPGTFQQIPNPDDLLVYHVRLKCKLALLPLRLEGEASYVHSV